MTESDTILVLLAGGHASGKESGAKILKEQLETKFLKDGIQIKLINMKNYYKNTANSQTGSQVPTDFDFIKLKDDLGVCLEGEEYDVIILYGLYALYDNQIVDRATVKVYIDCDSDMRLGRWIKRDVLQESYEGKTEEQVDDIKAKQKDNLEKLLDVYLNHSRQEMKLYIQDTKEKADIILPRGADALGFTLIVDGLQTALLQKLQQRGHLEVTMSSSSIRTSSANGTPMENRSWSTSSVNREKVIHSLKSLSSEPSVMSLTNDNFSNTNKIFYDVN